MELADYAVEWGLNNKPVFSWWLPHFLKKRTSIISKIKTKYWSQTHKYGICVPKTVCEARILDSQNGDTLWWDAILLEMKDVRVDYFCSSGPGGQSVNTTYSAVRLTHTPTGLVAQCQDQKSQHKNKEKAFKVLRSRLYDLELAKKNAEDALKRGSQVTSGDRSAKIRTYNYSQGRVTDHRINLTLYDLSNIIDGDIQKIIDELQLVDNTERLKESGDTF